MGKKPVGAVTTKTSWLLSLTRLHSNIATMTAKNPITGDQITRFQYGTTLGSGARDSAVAQRPSRGRDLSRRRRLGRPRELHVQPPGGTDHQDRPKRHGP